MISELISRWLTSHMPAQSSLQYAPNRLKPARLTNKLMSSASAALSQDTVPWSASVTPPPRELRRLPQIRADFERALSDIRSQEAAQVLEQICHAQSLRDLWHLRMNIYIAIARQRCQDEAHRRLAGLDRHFPIQLERSVRLTRMAARERQHTTGSTHHEQPSGQ